MLLKVTFIRSNTSSDINNPGLQIFGAKSLWSFGKHINKTGARIK